MSSIQLSHRKEVKGGDEEADPSGISDGMKHHINIFGNLSQDQSLNERKEKRVCQADRSFLNLRGRNQYGKLQANGNGRNAQYKANQRACDPCIEDGFSGGKGAFHPDDCAQCPERRKGEGQKEGQRRSHPMLPGHEIVAQFMAQKDEHNGDGITRSSRHPGGNHRQDEENNMDEMATHEKGLFLFLVTIPVESLFVFVFSHLLSSLLNDASHKVLSSDDLDRELINNHIRLGSQYA